MLIVINTKGPGPLSLTSFLEEVIPGYVRKKKLAN